MTKALEFPIEYDDMLDYVGYRQDYLQPTQMSQKIVLLKGENSWSWDQLKRLIPTGLYNDISDHFPVVAEVIFSRVHATVYPALSDEQSVGQSVRPSITFLSFGLFWGIFR